MHEEHPLALIDTDHRRLVRAAARLLGPADAEDAVQDAYVRALEADTLKLNAAQAWLLTVVRHLAIDRLRRRTWMQQWLAELTDGDTTPAAPSAERDAALAQEVTRALRLLAARLTPVDGAAVLLHLVFEAGHAEIARAGGRSEAGSRQQLRRALLRLRQADGAPAPRPRAEPDPGEETVFRSYLQSLQLRNPQTLWAMLRQPAITALAAGSTVAAASAPPATACGVVQVGGQLGLVLTLDGVTLCVLPLGVQCTSSADRDAHFA
nr:sigma-70 family RNA polymerase sigma factor [uncultured Roseateles sp.]